MLLRGESMSADCTSGYPQHLFHVYFPEVATVPNAGWPVRLAYVPAVATGAKAGVLVRSVYLPEVATVAKLGCPVRLA